MPAWRRRLPAVLALCLIAALYLSSLQRTVNGSDHDYTLDTAEIQVALNTGGTVHYTGYPLYTMLSTAVTLALRSVGVHPAAAASFSSLLWSLLALGLFYLLLLHLTEGSGLLSAAGLLLLAATETVWVHSVTAEVYSFSLLLAAAVLLLALRLAQRPGPRGWLLLMLTWGAAVAHHRSLLMLLPALLIAAPALGPLLRRNPRWLLAGLLIFLLPFAFYLYLPLRAAQGAAWVYGNPQTWRGFWEQFSGSEVTGGLLRLPAREELPANAHFLLAHLHQQLPLPLLIGGIGGLLWALYRRAWWAGGLLGICLALCAFVFLFPPAVWAPAVLMPVILALVAGLAVLGQRAGRRWPAPSIFSVLLAGAAVGLAMQNRPFVQQLVHDRSGEKVIASLEQLQSALPPGQQAVVAIPWGTRYFAASFGGLVEGRLPDLTLVDHRADFRQLAAAPAPLLTPVYTLNYWPLTWWEARLGQAHLAQTAPGFVQISSRPHAVDAQPAHEPLDTGVGIQLWAELDATNSDALLLNVWWHALQPITADYHVAVHLVANDPPQGPEDILAQADAVHPLDGWYPTSRWPVGQTVRETYSLPHTPTQPAAIRIGFYRLDDNGQFENSAWLSLPSQ